MAIARGWTRSGFLYVLAGLQAGVAGALVMTGWLMIGSAWTRHSIWTVPNLFSIMLWGPDAYTGGFTRASWSGIALIVVIYGLAGVIPSAIWRGRRTRFPALQGLIAGLVAYEFFFSLVWKRFEPLIPLYGPERLMLLGHIWWGLVVARSPHFAAQIAAAMSEPPPLPEIVVAPSQPVISHGGSD